MSGCVQLYDDILMVAFSAEPKLQRHEAVLRSDQGRIVETQLCIALNA